MRVVVTGGAGFIGSALVRHLVLEKDYEVLNIDALTYAGYLPSLKAVEGIDAVDRRDVHGAILRVKDGSPSRSRAFSPRAS